MVEGAALEMLCTEMYLGFESLTLRQIDCLICLPDKSGNFRFPAYRGVNDTNVQEFVAALREQAAESPEHRS